MLMTVGKIMMPRMMDAARIESPGPPIYSRIKGARTITPRNPKTTEGIPASSSMVGLMMRITRRGRNSFKKIAPAMPSGAPISIAPKVT